MEWGITLNLLSLRITALAAIALLLGCAAPNVAVPTEFPIPVVRAVPLDMAAYLAEDLTSYVHKEELKVGGEWQIDIGIAQQSMFDKLFTGIFKSHQFVDDPADIPAGVAGVLEPKIAEVQFSTPKQTRSDFFEVWIRYQFKLTDADGTLVGEWPMTAYGKSNVRNYKMQKKSPPLQAAAFAACRDAMAFFTLQFQTVPAVKTWLEAKTSPTIIAKRTESINSPNTQATDSNASITGDTR